MSGAEAMAWVPLPAPLPVGGWWVGSVAEAGLRRRGASYVRPNRHRRPRSLVCLEPADGFLAFSSVDFEILRAVGAQGWLEVTEWEYRGEGAQLARLTQPGTTVERSNSVVRLYEARVVRGPLRNSRVLLKEFLEEAGRQLWQKEADAYALLCGVGAQFRGEYVASIGDAPIATFLGTFVGDTSFQSSSFGERWSRALPNAGDPPVVGSPWLVFRWEGTATAAGLLRYRQPSQFGDRLFPDAAFNRLARYLRVLMRKSLAALDFVHTRGVVHKSIGLESILLNTVDATLVNDLDVRLKDFGFAMSMSDLSEQDLRSARSIGALDPSQISKFMHAEDVCCLGYAFLEIVFNTLSDSGQNRDSEPASDLLQLKRLVEDVFDWDLARLRAYFLEDPQWRRPVAFLDERDGSGWDLIEMMLRSRDVSRRLDSPSSATLERHPFL